MGRPFAPGPACFCELGWLPDGSARLRVGPEAGQVRKEKPCAEEKKNLFPFSKNYKGADSCLIHN
jgi:hypothetical protein